MSERTVTGVIKGREEVLGNEGPQYKVSFESPFFESKYPQILYVPQDLGDQVKVGAQTTLVLYTDGRPSKDEYSGEKPWHYRWRFTRVANPEDAGQPTLPVEPVMTPAMMEAGGPPAPVAAPKPAAQQASLPFDARNTSIERQVAAKAATDIYIAHATLGTVVEWDQWFELVLDRIQNGPKPADSVPVTPDDLPFADSDEPVDLADHL